MERLRIGVVGCGKISAAYFKGCREFPILDVVACADLVAERAAAQAAELNRGFVQRHQHARPLVRMKIAASLDGKTALASGESQWITGTDARADAHHMRAATAAILTGIGTVLRDDPRMTARLGGTLISNGDGADGGDGVVGGDVVGDGDADGDAN